MRNRTFVYANLLALVATLTVNYFSNALPLNGKTPAQLSDDFPNLFVPAGATFSIWGIIYSWLLVFAVYQTVALFRPAVMQKIEMGLQKMGWMFVATCLLNIGWLFAWHWNQVLLSVLVMVCLLVSLLTLNARLGSGLSASNGTEKWVMQAPFGIYQGWITVALIANVTALLVGHQWGRLGLSEATWAMTMIAIGASVAVAVLFSKNNVFHGLAVVWALYGIYLKRQDIGDAASLSVATTALVAMGVVALAVVLRASRWWAY